MGMTWLWPCSATSLKAITDNAADTNNRTVVTSSLARLPIRRPNRPAMAEPMMGRKTMAAYISALHHIDILNRDGAAVAGIDDQDGRADGSFGGGHRQHEQREHVPHQIAQ